MRYRDLISIYKAKTSKFNQSPVADEGSPRVAHCIIEESAELTRNGYYDQMVGDAHLYMPANNALQPDEIFVEYNGRMYQVSDRSDGKRSLTTNRLTEIEYSLSAVDKEAA